MKINSFWKGAACILPLLLGLWSCKTDAPVVNKAPETQLFINEFKLTGQNRLQSLVRLHWSGEDTDGIVTAYDISTDNANWARVTVTDSLFRFNITSAADTADINFFVRAIDDKGLADPTPASLKVPVRNTPPVVKIDTATVNDRFVMPIKTIGWTASDADGDNTLRSVEIRTGKSGEWLALPPETRLITVVPDKLDEPNVGTASVYINDSDVPFRNKLSGVSVSDFEENRFYLRATDIGNLVSNIDSNITPIRFAVRRSKVMLLDSWILEPDVQPRVSSSLNTIYRSAVSVFDLNTKLPVQRNITFDRLFALYDEIYWFAQLTETQLNILESSEATIQSYLNRGGKLFLGVTLNAQVDSLSTLFNYTPMARRTRERDGIITRTGSLQPVAPGGNGYPPIPNTSGGLVSRVNPFELKPGAVAIYQAEMVTGDNTPWNESRTVIAKQIGPDGKTNLIFSSVPIHTLAGETELFLFLERIKAEFAR